MRVDAPGGAGNETATTERDTCVEAGATKEFCRRRNVDTDIIAIGVEAIHRTDLGIIQAHLHGMSRPATSIQAHRIVNGGVDILRSLTGADIRLHHVETIVSSRT